MAQIAGVTLIKNSNGRVTHIKLSRRYFSQFVEYIEDTIALKKAKRGESIPWSEARKKLNKKFGFKD